MINFEPRVENDIIKTVLNGLNDETSNFGRMNNNDSNYQSWKAVQRNSQENSNYYQRMTKNDLSQNNLNQSFSEPKKIYQDEAPLLLVSDVLTEDFKKSIFSAFFYFFFLNSLKKKSQLYSNKNILNRLFL